MSNDSIVYRSVSDVSGPLLVVENTHKRALPKEHEQFMASMEKIYMIQWYVMIITTLLKQKKCHLSPLKMTIINI